MSEYKTICQPPDCPLSEERSWPSREAAREYVEERAESYAWTHGLHSTPVVTCQQTDQFGNLSGTVYAGGNLSRGLEDLHQIGMYWPAYPKGPYT